MDSSTEQSNCGSPVHQEKESSCASMVDPFLIEALENSRHRLTVLRMELDIQRFLKNPQQLQFEFPHFPTSYLRLAAHRVAQHYGLQTMALDHGLDGLGSRIIVTKTPESKYPSVFLSDIPAKQPENCKLEPIKIAIRPRPSGSASGDSGDLGSKRNPVRTVEERKEEYDKARARIFCSSDVSASDDTTQVSAEVKNFPMPKDDTGGQSSGTDVEKTLGYRDVGNSSRVAIFRDREKDRTDPDYDRSYERYVKSFPSGQRLLAPFNAPTFQAPLMQFNTGYVPQMGGQMHLNQTSLNYGPSPDVAINQFASLGIGEASKDAIHMQWASPTMMYAHSYGPFRHNAFQAPFCQQQPLSFDYSLNH